LDLVFNVILLLLSTTATLSAFGGATWCNGSKSLLRRVTIRGWISIACLFIALIIGIFKELHTAAEGEVLRSERDGALSKLSAANLKLDELTKDLSTTKNQLLKQTDISVLTALSKNYSIIGGELQLNFSEGPWQTNDLIECLFSNIPKDYRELAYVELTFCLNSYNQTFAFLSYRGNEVDVNQFNPLGLGMRDLEFSLGARSGHRTFIVFKKNPLGSESQTNAAVGFIELCKSQKVATINLRFTKYFNNKEQLLEYMKSHKMLKTVRVNEGGLLSVDFEIPNSIKSKIVNYWQKAVQSAQVNLVLKGGASFMITVNTKIGAPTISKSGIAIAIQTIGRPEIAILSEEIL